VDSRQLRREERIVSVVLNVEPKKKKAKPGPKPDPARVRAVATLIRSTRAWKDAVEAFAEWDRTSSVADLIDKAIVAYARERRYDKPFPKR
jgi:hypothetical protein